MNQYLYAIVDRLPTLWHPPTAGIAGASVVPRRIDNVVVLGSLLDTAPAAGPRTLALHQDVVATLIDAPATLPLPYGTTVPATGLYDWLAVRRGVVGAALGSVRGCVEMTVKLLRLDHAIARQMVGRDPRSDSAALDGPGDPELQALADALAERAALPHWRYRPSGRGGNVAAAVAFLVPRSDLAGFLARIAPVASHALGVAVVPTGPWAPSSFVPDLVRTPPARLLPDAGLTSDRRAG